MRGFGKSVIVVSAPSAALSQMPSVGLGECAIGDQRFDQLIPRLSPEAEIIFHLLGGWIERQASSPVDVSASPQPGAATSTLYNGHLIHCRRARKLAAVLGANSPLDRAGLTG
jgi:hypothetical protein